MDRLDLPFELRANPDLIGEEPAPVGVFEGLAAAFGNVDRAGDVLEKGAFRDALARPGRVKMLLHHDQRLPVGVWEELAETDSGLMARGRINMDKQIGRDTLSDLKMGVLDGLSIGFRVPPGGATFDRERGARRLKTDELMEISIVALPANERARVAPASVKAELAMGSRPGERAFELLLRDAGCSRKQAKAFIAGGYLRAFGRQRDAETDVADLVAALQAATRTLNLSRT